MGLVAAFGTLQTREPADPAVQAQVKKLQDFITENYYTCTKPILYRLDRCMVPAASLRRTSTLPGEKVRQNSHRKPLKFIADKPKVGVNIRLLQLAWSVDDETLRNKQAPASG